MGSNAFIFPGQGSQSVGMGQELANNFASAKAVFDEVDAALGENLSALIFAGREEDLRMTQNTQPALMAVSMAVVKVLEELGVTVEKDSAFVAGHSLGEYSALCAAGAISISDAAQLLRLRGLAMQRAVPVGQGAMAALLGLEMSDVEELVEQAAQGQTCDVANDNSPGQVVVSGEISAVERAIEFAKSKGAKRALMLPVSAPFHCQLMAPAAEEMEEALTSTKISEPSVPVVSNITASPISDPAEIRQRLVQQVTGRVRWTESVQWLASEGGVDTFVELGAGKVLSGLIRRIDRGLGATSIGNPDDARSFAAKDE